MANITMSGFAMAGVVIFSVHVLAFARGGTVLGCGSFKLTSSSFSLFSSPLTAMVSVVTVFGCRRVSGGSHACLLAAGYQGPEQERQGQDC